MGLVFPSDDQTKTVHTFDDCGFASLERFRARGLPLRAFEFHFTYRTRNQRGQHDDGLATELIKIGFEIGVLLCETHKPILEKTPQPKKQDERTGSEQRDLRTERWQKAQPDGQRDHPGTQTDEDNDDDYEISLNQMIAGGVGAHYGEFTGAVYKDDKDADSPTHSILANTDNAKYWIEILKYADSDSVGGAGLIVNDDAPAPADILDLRLNPSVVYRITAWAKGLKPNSTAVIQQTYARTRLQD